MPPKHRAKWLRELKRIRDITIQEIADQAEVATATVEKLLAGEIEGVVLHTNTMADLDLESYDAACAWMDEHGDEVIE